MDGAVAAGLLQGLQGGLDSYLKIRQMKNEEQRLLQQQLFQQQQAEDMGLLRRAQTEESQARARALDPDFILQRDAQRAENQRGLLSQRLAANQGKMGAEANQGKPGTAANRTAIQQGNVLIPGFETDPNVRIDAKGVEAVRKAAIDSTAMKDGISDLRSALSSASTSDRFNPLSQNYTDIGSKLRELQLQKKELANLGVLNGPDLKIVDEALGGDPRFSLKSPKIFLNQLQQAEAAIDRGLQKKAQLYGFRRSSAQQQPGLINSSGGRIQAPANAALPSQIDQQAVQWAQANPQDPRSAAILKANGF